MMYGQTEATARMTVLSPADASGYSASIGKPIPGGSIEIVHPETRVKCAPGEIGEIVYSGPNVSLGYSTSRESLLEGDVNHGTLNTGDLGWMSSDGFVHVTGRLKRAIKLFGNRISLDEVETWTSQHLGEVACVGREDELHLFACSPEVQSHLVRNMLAKWLRIHQSAIHVHVVDQIPRSNSGKVLYVELEAKIGVDES